MLDKAWIIPPNPYLADKFYKKIQWMTREFHTKFYERKKVLMNPEKRLLSG